MSRPAPVPFRNPAVGVRDGMVTTPWVHWLQSLVDAIGLAPARASSYQLAAYGAALPATDAAAGLGAGLYRLSSYLRITRPATTSSSVIVTVSWTDGGVVCSVSGGAVTGNTTATVQSAAIVVRVDAGTAIRVSAAYASSGATTMQYDLDIRVEAVP